MSFKEWLSDQVKREDAVGWVARWFFQARGRKPTRDSQDALGFYEVAEEKASKAQKDAVRAALDTARAEWKGTLKVKGATVPVDGEDGDVISVRPTVARLRLAVKGSHESGEIEEEEEIEVTRFKGPVATVGMRQRLTTSYGGDWVQLGVMLSLPCYPEEIEEAFKFADEWITEKIRTEVAKFKGGSLPDAPSDASGESSDGSREEEQDQSDVEKPVEELGEESEGEKDDTETFKLEPESADGKEDFGF